MSEFDDQIERIVLRAYRVRKSMNKVCQKAGIPASTWSRWLSGRVNPNQPAIDRLNAALDEFERDAA